VNCRSNYDNIKMLAEIKADKIGGAAAHVEEKRN
jgi:hypothetical protein